MTNKAIKRFTTESIETESIHKKVNFHIFVNIKTNIVSPVNNKIIQYWQIRKLVAFAQIIK